LKLYKQEQAVNMAPPRNAFSCVLLQLSMAQLSFNLALAFKEAKKQMLMRMRYADVNAHLSS
jgi:hypothetical protein